MSPEIPESSKLRLFIDRMRIVEVGFIHKLKMRNPTITQDEIALEVQRWYMTWPGAEHGNCDGVVGDVCRGSGRDCRSFRGRDYSDNSVG